MPVAADMVSAFKDSTMVAPKSVILMTESTADTALGAHFIIPNGIDADPANSLVIHDGQ